MDYATYLPPNLGEPKTIPHIPKVDAIDSWIPGLVIFLLSIAMTFFRNYKELYKNLYRRIRKKINDSTNPRNGVVVLFFLP